MSCEEQIEKSDGFLQPEIERLLMSDFGKVWKLSSKEVDGGQVDLWQFLLDLSHEECVRAA